MRLFEALTEALGALETPAETANALTAIAMLVAGCLAKFPPRVEEEFFGDPWPPSARPPRARPRRFGAGRGARGAGEGQLMRLAKSASALLASSAPRNAARLCEALVEVLGEPETRIDEVTTLTAVAMLVACCLAQFPPRDEEEFLKILAQQALDFAALARAGSKPGEAPKAAGRAN
jgi:hypothetical protein